MSNDNFFLPLISGIFISYVFISNSNKSIDDITIYQRYCSDFKHNVFSCPKSITTTKTEFKIFIEKQMVVANTLIPSAYKNCNVFDKENWHCDEGDGKFIAIQNGDFYESNEGSIDANGKHSMLPRGNQIPRYLYYYFTIRDFLLKLGKVASG